MPATCLLPRDAYRKYIMIATGSPGWLEDSSKVSADLPLSKRELLGLILIAHMRTQCGGATWMVGYDPQGAQPNDGFVSDGIERTTIEHKLVPQMADEGALDAVLSTYDKSATRGPAYGEDRVLLIHTNKGTDVAIRVSDLRDRIGDNCPFEQVLLILCANTKGTIAMFDISEYFPNPGLAAVVHLDLTTGDARVTCCR